MSDRLCWTTAAYLTIAMGVCKSSCAEDQDARIRVQCDGLTVRCREVAIFDHGNDISDISQCTVDGHDRIVAVSNKSIYELSPDTYAVEIAQVLEHPHDQWGFPAYSIVNGNERNVVIQRGATYSERELIGFSMQGALQWRLDRAYSDEGAFNPRRLHGSAIMNMSDAEDLVVAFFERDPVPVVVDIHGTEMNQAKLGVLNTDDALVSMDVDHDGNDEAIYGSKDELVVYSAGKRRVIARHSFAPAGHYVSQVFKATCDPIDKSNRVLVTVFERGRVFGKTQCWIYLVKFGQSQEAGSETVVSLSEVDDATGLKNRADGELTTAETTVHWYRNLIVLRSPAPGTDPRHLEMHLSDGAQSAELIIGGDGRIASGGCVRSIRSSAGPYLLVGYGRSIWKIDVEKPQVPNPQE